MVLKCPCTIINTFSIKMDLTFQKSFLSYKKRMLIKIILKGCRYLLIVIYYYN